MIRHCVLFRWLPDTTDDQVDEIAKLLREYVATLDGVVSYRFGRDIGVTDGTYDFAVVGDFESRDAYLTYRDSPRHVEIVKGVVAQLLAERASVQFEFD
jgi:quinol monooxygenase YgiN